MTTTPATITMSRRKELKFQSDPEASKPTAQAITWLTLAGALLSLFFADGPNTIAVAAWLAPALLLRFVRSQPTAQGLAIAYVALFVTRGVIMRGVIPIPGIFYLIFLLISCVSALLPYVVDRLVSPHFHGVLNTLVFPSTLVATQFVYSHGPFGSWGSIPYTQSGNLPLLQLLSVTGLWGITFLIGWFAGAVNWTWQGGTGGLRARHPLAMFVVVYLAIVLGGSARLVLFPPLAETVRVASLSPKKDAPTIPDDLLQNVIEKKGDSNQMAEFRAIAVRGIDALLSATEREATAGAKIIFWSETAAYVLKQDEAEVVSRGRDLALKYHVHLGMALGTWTPGARFPLENKLVIIGPDGQIGLEYLKARPTPGPEEAMAVSSDGKLRKLDTVYGKMIAAICYDTDFPTLMSQAGRASADLVLSPASDWRAIDPRHTEIASFRAIEQGFNLVRQSNGGLSAAYDYEGRRLASMDHYQSSDLTLVAQVPTRGVRTVYSRLGDWLAWLNILAALILIIGAWRKTRRAA